MERLIYGTAAYKIFKGDADGDRLSHAYMLYFQDEKFLRDALKLFALKFFGAGAGSREERLIKSESLPDLKIYPAVGAKLTAEAAGNIVDDAALQPAEFSKKLFIISDFQTASPIFQNKLLKILEEPPEGVYFLLGTASLSPVLDTVRSRVKTLEIPPFTPAQIYSALERIKCDPLNGRAAQSCGGVLGAACNMLDGGWYKEVVGAAEEICAAGTVGKAALAALRYGDFQYKRELLCEMQRCYFARIRECAADPESGGALSAGAAIYAVQRIDGALADLRFNANFSSLLYDLLLSVAKRNRTVEG